MKPCTRIVRPSRRYSLGSAVRTNCICCMPLGKLGYVTGIMERVDSPLPDKARSASLTRNSKDLRSDK